VREEDFAGFLEGGRVFLAVEQMVQHAVEDLLGASSSPVSTVSS